MIDARKSKLAMAFVCCTVLAACGALDVKQDTIESSRAMRKGPEFAPGRSITNFSESLRCMDELMIEYGVKDVSTLVEDLADTTKKVSAGTKDMLISSVSDMTKRSRAIRLITFAADSGNLANFLANAEAKGAYAVVPQYDIRGSISQLDENLVKKQNDGAINIGSVGFGAAKTASSSVLGLDLSMISTKDYSVIPGVTTRNSVIIYKEGSGLDGEAQYKKFGISYGLTLTKAEGQAQALRSLVELAVVELFGKLTHTPYWRCLGADPKDTAIRNEISDWFYALTVNGELVEYFQKQLRLRAYYKGAVDGNVSPELSEAIARYRQALGLTREAKADLDFFEAYLSASHYEVVAKHPASAFEVTQAKRIATPGSSEEKSAAPPLALAMTANARRFRRGDLVTVVLKPSRAAHIYCYMRDDKQQIQRVFPNRFAKDSLVRADEGLTLPGSMRFEIVASEKGIKESIACFASERDLLPELPRQVVGVDFENVPVASLDHVRQAFSVAAGSGLASAAFDIDVR